MATSTNGRGTAAQLDWQAIAADIFDAYDKMSIPVVQYVLVVLLPAALVLVTTVASAVFLDLSLVVRLPILLFGTLVFGTALIFPKLLVEQEKRGLERQLHLVLTHMTVLSTTNIDRVEVFRTLAREEEYGRMATEMHRIVQLVDTWNQSLDEACRRRAREVPSKPVADFFDRLSYALSAGQDLSDFLLGEQNAMIQQYVTVYESSLDNLEVMKDLYLSMILSMTFALVNAIVLPILTGTDPTLVVAAVIVIFAFVQLGFYYVIKTMSPYDPVWYHPVSYTSRESFLLSGSVVAAFVLSTLLVAVGFLSALGVGPLASFRASILGAPLPMLVMLPIAPFLIPGLYFRMVENRIKECDTEFPGFIRALGASESAKQSTTTAVLRTLRQKDFGALSVYVEELYVRLNMRLDAVRAWFFFAADTRSYLVQKFSEMYNVGRKMGGDPKTLGDLISTNMNQINALREQRKQSAVTLIGILYGITAASTFSYFIGLEVVVILAEISMEMGLEDLSFGQFIYASVYDIPMIEYLLTLIILFNALLSSLMVREVDGGHKSNAYLHFVLLTWVSSILAIATQHLVGVLL